MKICESVSLKGLTTLKIGGVAHYFCRVRNEHELQTTLQFSKKKEVPLIILGGGSNVLLSDGSISALVAKIDIKGIEWRESKHFVHVLVGAGESWDTLVEKAVKKGLWGIENLSGIPGTVGAAPIQNIGAYGAEIKNTLKWVKVLDTKTGKSRRLSNKKCEFGYRDSIFKHPKGKALIITHVALRLKKSGTPNLVYKDLKERFKIYDLGFKNKKRELTPAVIRKAVIGIRSKKFPDLRECGTAGSFFKNPIIPKTQFDALKKRYPALPGFPLTADERGYEDMRINADADESLRIIKDKGLKIKIPLAWLLDNVCGLKGFHKGNVALFERQPIVLVNTGGASADEIKKFAEKIVLRVRKETGIDIEWEVQKIY